MQCIFPLLAAAALLSGCDGLLDSQYDGEPLMTLRGTVSPPPDGFSAEAPRAAVLWLNMAPLGLSLRADDVELSTDLGSFELSIPRLPASDEFPGTWSGIDYLPEEPNVHTLLAVVVAYDDLDGDAEPDLDYAGYQTLEWLRAPTEDSPLLFGDDEMIGLAEEFLVVATELPGTAELLSDAVDDLEGYGLEALTDLRSGVHPYAFIGGAWSFTGATDEVVLRLF